MSNQKLNSTIRELMDACRPNRDDVAEPEMEALGEVLDGDANARDVFARSQHLDRSIGEAFRDVQAPPGLAARLLASVGAEEEVAGAAPSDRLDKRVAPAKQASGKQSSRRRWMALAGAMAACVVVAVYAAVVMNEPDSPIPHYTVADKALGWLDETQDGDWDSSESSPLDNYPLAMSISVENGPPTVGQWQFIGTEYGRAAVYDLTPPGKEFVYLFTVRTGEQFSAPPLLPTQPARSTQGVCVGVAYHDGILHVLVVAGNEQRYAEFIEKRLPVI